MQTKNDFAKYPFVPDAAEYVKQLGLEIENLENPDFRPVLYRAEKRVEEALKTTAKIARHDKPRQEDDMETAEAWKDDIEIMSFPVAVVLAAASANDYIKRRYALAEAKRAYDLLKIEDEDKIMEIAHVFNWRIRSPQEIVGRRRFGYALFFTDFLKNTRTFREREWKLVNRILLNGEVYLTKIQVARLLQEEIQRHIEKRLSLDVRSMLSERLLERIENLKRKYASQIGKTKFEELQGRVVDDAFPPCVGQLYQVAKSGSHLSHVGRFTLTSFLLNIGMKLPEIVNLFRSSADFNERMTRYQVEHIAGDRGSRTKYIPPTCETLKTHGLCPGADDQCRRVRHPLSYYRRKMGMLKKEAPAC